MDSYESGNSELLEKIEELSQAIARLTAENRSTREWFMTRFQLLWESASKRDEAIGESMKSFLGHAEEMSRQIGLRETGEKLEALLKVPTPTPAIPVSTLPTVPTLPLPASRAATPKTALTPMTTPTGEPSSKRSADEDLGESKKRRKVGEL